MHYSDSYCDDILTILQVCCIEYDWFHVTLMNLNDFASIINHLILSVDAPFLQNKVNKKLKKIYIFLLCSELIRYVVTYNVSAII